MKQVPSIGLLLSTWALVLGLTAACSQPHEATLQGYGEAYRDYTLWPRPEEIPVCWEPGPDSFEAEKARVAELLAREYARAGIGFVFQGTCHEGSRGLRVAVDQQGLDYTSSLGALLDGKPAGMHLNWARRCGKGIEDSTCIVNTALHEFGHALGLRHEMNRRDHQDCHKDQTAGEGEKGGLQLGLYDKDSIMSYCRDRRKVSLSEGDVAVVADYYFSPIAKISGRIPVASADDLYILVEGLGIVAYRWLLTADPQLCLSEASYSPAASIDTFIHAETGNFSGGQRLHLCVLGQDEQGAWQRTRSFSSVTWLKL